MSSIYTRGEKEVRVGLGGCLEVPLLVKNDRRVETQPLRTQNRWIGVVDRVTKSVVPVGRLQLFCFSLVPSN